MSDLSIFVHAFLACNLHFCLYVILAISCCHRALLCAERGRYDEMREELMHGIVYVLLGTL